jgi:hypothetical protein
MSTNDTHGTNAQGWYGFDLDGTLAFYDEWKGIDHIGEPIAPMVDLIRKMHQTGKFVKILTARVSPRAEAETRPNPYYGHETPDYVSYGMSYAKALYGSEYWNAKQFIQDWCIKHLGFMPEVTHEKDYAMLALYDDRVKQVIPNKGILLEDLVRERCGGFNN